MWWHDAVEGEATSASSERMGAEDTLFLLHTSERRPSRGRAAHDRRLPPARLRHAQVDFDIHDDTVWWCAADIGWVTGHSYIVYGPLNNGTTSVLYEGDPAYPDWDRHWEIVERYGVNSYYTAPTLIRSFVKVGTDYPKRHDFRRSASSARSASRSTRRPGSGTGR